MLCFGFRHDRQDIATGMDVVINPEFRRYAGIKVLLDAFEP
jgi:hypothetical protein